MPPVLNPFLPLFSLFRFRLSWHCIYSSAAKILFLLPIRSFFPKYFRSFFSVFNISKIFLRNTEVDKRSLQRNNFRMVDLINFSLLLILNMLFFLFLFLFVPISVFHMLLTIYNFFINFFVSYYICLYCVLCSSFLFPCSSSAFILFLDTIFSS